MRAVIQRVKRGKVSAEKEVLGEISEGLVVLLGVSKNDTESEAKYLAQKILNLRIFEDAEGKLNLSVLDKNGEILVISQFTLYGDCSKGNRPSFTESADKELANFLYEKFIHYLKESNLKIKTGKFQAKMLVEIYNDGPVTIILDKAL